MKVHVLASGSRGNAMLVCSGGSCLLIDAGLPFYRILEGIEAADIRPEGLSGLIITHEHTDHSLSAAAVSRRLNLTVMANRATLAALSDRGRDGFHGVEPFETGQAFSAGGFVLTPFPVPHDCAQGVGLVVESGGKRFGICTDLGFATSLVRERLTGLDALIIESNHDPVMLMEGTYPWHIKQRIKSREGHLSNMQCAELLRGLVSDRLRTVVLAHLSQQNNTPDIALACARDALGAAGENIELLAASQDEPLTFRL